MIVLIKHPEFFFRKGSYNKGVHLVNSKKVTRPKHLGGLNIRTTREANTCFLGKLVWDMIQSKNKLWVNLLSNKYTGGPNILHANAHTNCSPSWSSIIRAKDTLKSGYSWRAGSGSSFWFRNWSPHGFLGTSVPVIDIHDLHHSVKDVFSNNGPHTRALYTILPPAIEDYINNTHINFNASVEDAFIWSHNKNGVYSTKSGYSWLLSLSESRASANHHLSWTWIWKLKVPEKYKFLVWLACHDAAPTLSLLHHRNIAQSASCTRCGCCESDSKLEFGVQN